MSLVLAPLLLLFGSMQNDFTPFIEKSGCEHYFEIYYNCTAGPAFDLGCSQIRDVRLLAGFGVPVAECHGGPADASGSRAFIRQSPGGMDREPGYVRLLIATPDGFEVVHTLDELAQRFAPVETVEEAMSFALIGSGASLYDKSWKTPTNYRRVLGRVRPTDVVRRGDGSFLVRNLLFSYSGGCVPAPYVLGDIAVSRSGVVTSASSGTTLATNP